MTQAATTTGPPTAPARPAERAAAAATDPDLARRPAGRPVRPRPALADRAAARLVATGPFDRRARRCWPRSPRPTMPCAPGTGGGGRRPPSGRAGLPVGGRHRPSAGRGRRRRPPRPRRWPPSPPARPATAATAGRLRARLAPHADLACGDGYRTFAGAAAFHLGRLAALAGDGAEAERHLLVALRLHTAWRARPWVAWTQDALADRPRRPRPAHGP